MLKSLVCLFIYIYMYIWKVYISYIGNIEWVYDIYKQTTVTIHSHMAGQSKQIISKFIWDFQLWKHVRIIVVILSHTNTYIYIFFLLKFIMIMFWESEIRKTKYTHNIYLKCKQVMMLLRNCVRMLDLFFNSFAIYDVNRDNK